VPDRRSLERSAISQQSGCGLAGLGRILLVCGFAWALAIATPVAAQTGGKPDAVQKSPSGEGAAGAPAAPSPEAAASKPAKAATATKKGPNAASVPDAKGSAGLAPSIGLSSEHGPIDVHSDTLDLDYKAKVVLYRGHVHVTQGSSSLTSDNLQVQYNGDFHDIKEAIATGNVRMSQGGRWATSDRAKLNQVDRTVEMTGNPIIHDGPDRVAGTRILIYLDSQKSVVEQAHAVIFPKKGEERDDQNPNDHDR